MFATILPILIELFKYQTGSGLSNKIQITQEQIQKNIEESVTLILIRFFGGLICAVAICWAMLGLFNLIQTYIETLAYATEIKIAFYLVILGAAAFGLKAIFGQKRTMTLQMPEHVPLQNQQEVNVVQSALNKFMEGLNEGLAANRNKKTS